MRAFPSARHGSALPCTCRAPPCRALPCRALAVQCTAVHGLLSASTTRLAGIRVRHGHRQSHALRGQRLYNHNHRMTSRMDKAVWRSEPRSGRPRGHWNVNIGHLGFEAGSAASTVRAPALERVYSLSVREWARESLVPFFWNPVRTLISTSEFSNNNSECRRVIPGLLELESWARSLTGTNWGG